MTLAKSRNPQHSHYAIICSYKTVISLAQMKQSNGCGSVRNNEIFDLGSGASPWFSILAYCKTPAHPFIPSAKTVNPGETKNPGKRSNSQQIVSYCLGLCTENPGLLILSVKTSNFPPKT